MNFFFLTILVFISPTLSETQGLLLPFPKLRSIFSKLKKRQDGGYLEQCGVVDFEERNLGRVNVLAFFDASWQYSHRQATMLKELKGRFERSGMVNIKFFVINSLPEAITDEAEVQIEEETWKAISPSEAEGFPLVDTSLGSLNKTLGPEFYLMEDKPQLQIWKKFHVSRDQILVVDGCGKLTYQVIVPWSILHFPYVKAAILSTYKDDPCGPCKEKLKSESASYGTVNDEITTIGYGSDVPKGITEEMKREEVTTEIKEDERKVVSEIEERTTEEIETMDFLRTESLNMDETTVEQMKTDGAATEEIKTDGTTTEQIKTDGTTTEQIKTDGTTTGQIKTNGTITEPIKTDGTITEQIKIDGTTTEQIKIDGTTLVPLEIEDSTTEKIGTTDFLRIIPGKMVETTIEQMKEDGMTTEQIETDGTTTEQMKTDGTTTEKMETMDFLRTIPSRMDETTIEQMKTDGITTEQMKTNWTTTERIETDGTILVPLEIEDSTTEEMKTTDFLRKILVQEVQTTTEQIQRDGTVTEQIKIEGASTEKIETADFLRTVPFKMDETTIEQMKTDGITTEQMITDRIRTEQVKTDRTTTEQIETDGTTLVSLQIEDSTTEEMAATDFFRKLPLQIEQTTRKQSETDGTTIPFPPGETTQYIKIYVDYPSDTNHQEKDKKLEKLIPENLEIDYAEDPQHTLSKYPNFRSISTENYKNTVLDENFENRSAKNEENANPVPIRIIMKAPHFDIYENSVIKHDYLILKTDDPDLHDHFDRGIKIDSLNENLNLEEGSADFENWTDIWKIVDRNLNQNDKINNENNNETKIGWYGFHINTDNDHKDSRKIKKRIFGKDESPGLFGEVADYWRNDGVENFYDDSYDNEDDKNYDTEKDPKDKAETSFKAFQATKEKNFPKNQKESIKNSGYDEEEAKNKLIAHYSKLLPWIYYILN